MSARFDKNQEGLVSFESRKKKANCVCSTMNPGESFVCLFVFFVLTLFCRFFTSFVCNSMQFRAEKMGPSYPLRQPIKTQDSLYFILSPGCSSDLINTVTELPNQQCIVALDWLRQITSNQKLNTTYFSVEFGKVESAFCSSVCV